MGRKPTVNLNLPEGMRARRRPNGRTYYYLDTGERRPRREIPLGTDYPEAVRRWAELTVTGTAPPVTFKEVSDRYVREALPLKAPRTREDNLEELVWLLAFFNDPPVPIEAIEPQHVRQYLDWRVQASRAAAQERNAERVAAGKKPLEIKPNLGHVRANREKALLSHIWNWARERGVTSLENPCRGVKGYTEEGRDEYVEDAVYKAVYAVASQGLQDALDLAYLAGQRPADTLRYNETDLRDHLLHVDQGKTKAKLRVRTTDAAGQPNELGRKIAEILARKRQRAAAAAAAGRKVKVADLALVCGANGLRMTESALDNAFDRARALAIRKHPELAAQIKAFQFRDLRAKAGTDKNDADGLQAAQRLLGHASSKMTEHYVRKGNIVTPTR
ncbi:Integrase family protein [Hydrogenophaga intermedia]|uniref:Integrase family protein n=1 Tax=Hydrogenophaga intermedia TaxID=65786 RepID=A0A1L1PMW9_HYDIT|nr:tyrosine-type recombinase/integrase [Hydrogenophaga intermedia]CDN87386.1 Integrase family protein [Hydrogenophaga intermedia]